MPISPDEIAVAGRTPVKNSIVKVDQTQHKNAFISY